MFLSIILNPLGISAAATEVIFATSPDPTDTNAFTSTPPFTAGTAATILAALFLINTPLEPDIAAFPTFPPFTAPDTFTEIPFDDPVAETLDAIIS
jgi:hypothetical protein